MVVDWLWRLCKMTVESADVPEDWKFAVIVPLYNDKIDRTECRSYRGRVEDFDRHCQ